ncbi:MAG: type II toxin-antitoxin system Phd/YefM family antitoxin [Aeromicrobium sp.]|nr:type II toxin-antitoxin system Phd/YefM family antitoxin [Burkholderiales bacterium]
MIVVIVFDRRLMTTIQASEFKAKCLALMDEVARSGQSLVITKNGKPVAELKPYRPPRAKSLIGLTKGQGKILGDIISPIDVEWDAMK